MVQSSGFDSTESIIRPKLETDRKENALTDVRGFSEDSTCSRSAWRPSFFQTKPLLGLLALLVAIGAMFAALVVLLVSDGQRVSSWSVQPTVYLAIAAAVGVSAMRFAKARALPVAWWHAAYQGNTVRALEYQWEAGQSLVGAVKYAKYARWVSCSTVLYLLMIVDGAMLQQASTVISKTVSSEVSLKMQMSPELPTGFSGIYINETEMEKGVVTKIGTDYLHGNPILLDAQGCDDGASCSAKVLGPGVQMSTCKNQTWPISKAMFHSPNATWGLYHSFFKGGQVDYIYNSAFEVSVQPIFSRNNSLPETAGLYFGILDLNDDGGQYIFSACELTPAILEYTVQFSGGQVSLVSPDQARFVALANNTIQPAIYNPVQKPATYASFYDVLQIFVAANASAAFPVPARPGDYWSLDAFTMDAEAAKYLEYTASEGKELHFRDPRLGVLGALNSLLFHGGVVAGSRSDTAKLIDPGLSTTQTVRGSQELRENLYHTDLRWFAGAAVLDLLAILSILPLFWGFWRIPPGITQSPFSLALAFNAPLLEDIHSTAGAQGVVNAKGDLKVAFGQVQDQPASFIVMSESQYGSHSSGGRLGIGKSRQVLKPEVGTTFTE